MESQIIPQANTFEEENPTELITDIFQSVRRQWQIGVIVGASVFTGVIWLTLNEQPAYQSETLILLSNDESAAVEIPGFAQTNLTSSSEDLATEVQILRSKSLLLKAIDRLGPEYSDITAEELQQNISIKQAGDADVIVVSYIDNDPKQTKEVLDVLGSTYVEYSLEKQRSQATSGIEFIDGQLPTLQQDLNNISSSVRIFQERYGIIDPQSYASQISTYKMDLQNQIQATSMELVGSQSQYRELQNQIINTGLNPEVAFASSVVSSDPIYQDLQSQLKAIETQYSLESTRFYDNNPIMEDLRLKRQNIAQLLQQRKIELLGSSAGTPTTNVGDIQQDITQQLLNAEININMQQTQLAQMQNLAQQVNMELSNIPKLQQYYTELQRQLQLKTEAVNQFLGKLQELKIAEAQEAAPWEVLEYAYVPDQPISPNVRRNLIMGAISAILLGIAAAKTLDSVDQRIKGVEEVKQLTNIPVLGRIPKTQTPKVNAYDSGELFTKAGANHYGYGQNATFTEAVRSLALNLRYLVDDKHDDDQRVIAVTSSRPSEGKSTITHNLAIILTELGYKVLLVDADMRKPNVHRLAELDNQVGLSTVIATHQHYQELITPSDVQNLDILTAGPTPPNPVAILNSPKMSTLLKQWRNTYDYVLVDTPPLGVSADALSVASQVDFVLLVASLRLVTRSAIKSSIDTLKRSNQCNLGGTVVNFLDKNDNDYYNSYYQYYGYGQEANGSKVNPSNSKKNIQKTIKKMFF